MPYDILFFVVPPEEIITNQFITDLDKLWELRHIIPNP